MHTRRLLVAFMSLGLVKERKKTASEWAARADVSVAIFSKTTKTKLLKTNLKTTVPLANALPSGLSLKDRKKSAKAIYPDERGSTSTRGGPAASVSTHTNSTVQSGPISVRAVVVSISNPISAAYHAIRSSKIMRHFGRQNKSASKWGSRSGKTTCHWQITQISSKR